MLKFTAWCWLWASSNKLKRIQTATNEWMITYKKMGRANYGMWCYAVSLVIA